jgi:ferric-dicitrate binding protein FerR (iron transport regulator)
MTHDKRKDLQVEIPELEARINDLLDGELDEAATAALKREAGEDKKLARAIIEAYELQRGMDHLGMERAPASLRKKLRQIPRAEKPFLRRRRWVIAAATASVPVMAISLLLMQPQQPSSAEVEQARQELALAFTYIDKVGYRTSDYLHTILGNELRRGVTDNLSRHFPYTEQSHEEEKS